METNQILEVIEKLVGKINPVGETNADDERFENLKKLCEITNELIIKIDYVSCENKDRHEYSMKRAGEYSCKFLTNTVRIPD